MLLSSARLPSGKCCLGRIPIRNQSRAGQYFVYALFFPLRAATSTLRSRERADGLCRRRQARGSQNNAVGNVGWQADIELAAGRGPAVGVDVVGSALCSGTLASRRSMSSCFALSCSMAFEISVAIWSCFTFSCSISRSRFATSRAIACSNCIGSEAPAAVGATSCGPVRAKGVACGGAASAVVSLKDRPGCAEGDGFVGRMTLKRVVEPNGLQSA